MYSNIHYHYVCVVQVRTVSREQVRALKEEVHDVRHSYSQ